MKSAIAPSDLGLEYPAWRPGQLEAVLAVASALGEGKQFVMVEAPPGTGKTGVAIGVSRLLGLETCFLTSTKDLQEQYRGLSRAPKVLGRPNFECRIKPAFSAAVGQCVSQVPCEYAGTGGNAKAGCLYYDQLRVGLAAPEAVLNYAFGLGGANYAGHFSGRDLWVCDEAHLLRKELEGFVRISLSLPSLRRLGVSPLTDGWAGYPTLAGWTYWAEKMLPELKTMKSELSSRVEDDGLRQDPESTRIVADPRTLAVLTRLIRDLELLTDGRPWVYTPATGSAEFQPVWVAPYGQRFLWRHAKKFLLMSATIGDAGLLCEVLGIDPQRVQVIRCPSVFDRTRRPIYYQPVTRVAGGSRVAASADILVPEIDRILDQHQNQKGLIHTVSYPLAWEILKRSRHQTRLVIPRPNTREETIRKFRDSLRPDVLLSPSMTTGLDLPDDLCRFVIWAKLPFTDRSDPVAIEQQKIPLGKKLSLQDTAQTLAQGYGRLMRSETDWGVCYVLDANYKWFKFAARTSLPRWFTEAVVYD